MSLSFSFSPSSSSNETIEPITYNRKHILEWCVCILFAWTLLWQHQCYPTHRHRHPFSQLCLLFLSSFQHKLATVQFRIVSAFSLFYSTFLFSLTNLHNHMPLELNKTSPVEFSLETSLELSCTNWFKEGKIDSKSSLGLHRNKGKVFTKKPRVLVAFLLLLLLVLFLFLFLFLVIASSSSSSSLSSACYSLYLKVRQKNGPNQLPIVYCREWLL